MLDQLRLRMALFLAPELRPDLRVAAPAEDDPILLPIWDSAHRPAWWRNAGLRRFLFQAHRKVTLAQARAEALARFGPVTPTTSSICRFWQRLDALQVQAPFNPSFKE